MSVIKKIQNPINNVRAAIKDKKEFSIPSIDVEVIGSGKRHCTKAIFERDLLRFCFIDKLKDFGKGDIITTSYNEIFKIDSVNEKEKRFIETKEMGVIYIYVSPYHPFEERLVNYISNNANINNVIQINISNVSDVQNITISDLNNVANVIFCSPEAMWDDYKNDLIYKYKGGGFLEIVKMIDDAINKGVASKIIPEKIRLASSLLRESCRIFEKIVELLKDYLNKK